MNIGGIEPFSSVDWPGKLCATVFLSGCPLRCEYCYNQHLQGVQSAAISDDELDSFINARKGLLDGIILSGGEPLMQKGVVPLAQRIKEKGFLVGLHTSGFYPTVLREILPHLDWVGFDYKTLFERYQDVTKTASSPFVKSSLSILLASKTPYEIRTTVDESHFSETLLALCEQELTLLGVSEWHLQVCQQSTREGALIPSTPSRELINRYMLAHPYTIARLRTT